jgi:hypothetical protein
MGELHGPMRFDAVRKDAIAHGSEIASTPATTAAPRS